MNAVPAPDSTALAGTISAHEAAAQLGILTTTVYLFVRQGILRGARFDLLACRGTKRLLRVTAESVEQYLARRAAPRPPRKPYVRKPRPILPDPWEGSDTVSVKEAAALLSRSVSGTFTLCSMGKLEKRLFPFSAYAKKGTTVRVPLASVEALRAKQEAAARLREEAKARAVRTPCPKPKKAAAPPKPGKMSALPPGCLPISQTAETTGVSSHLLKRLFRAGFLRGCSTEGGKVLIEVASVHDHRTATSSPAFWTPERHRRYVDASRPSRKVREAAA